MRMQEQAAMVANKASLAGYTAAGGTITVAGFTTNEIAMLVGVVIGIATFAVNWVYRHRSYKLEKARFDYDRGNYK